MGTPDPLIDIHCHLLPEIDDGSQSWEESLAMARLAAADGITAIIATPHQLGAYRHNDPATIRNWTSRLQERLREEGSALRVYPGADIRIEDDLIERLDHGELVTLADQGGHLLLEFPHDVVMPLDEILEALSRRHIQPILTHPERNRHVLHHRTFVEQLVEKGCLIQVTAGALIGSFGPAVRSLAEWLVCERLVHFVASDAHGSRARRPLLSRAFHRVAQLTDVELAIEVFCENPYRVVRGEVVPLLARDQRRYRFAQWFRWRKAG